MKDASKMILLDLAFVQGPSVVLVLADVKPRFRIPDWRRPPFSSLGLMPICSQLPENRPAVASARGPRR
jgi:hypothetical protein